MSNGDGSTQRGTDGWRGRLSRLGTSLALLAIGVDAMAGLAKPATKLVNVADSRSLPPGISHWIANVYNDSLWLFGLVVVVTMAGMGLVLGYACDRIMSLLGINLGRIQHHE